MAPWNLSCVTELSSDGVQANAFSSAVKISALKKGEIPFQISLELSGLLDMPDELFGAI